MKRRGFMAIVFFFLLLTACSETTNNPMQSHADNTVYYEIVQESKALYNVPLATRANCLSTQYYQGEPVQLWASSSSGQLTEIYLYREDGSRELLFENLKNADYLTGNGYLDNEGNLYNWHLQGSFRKISPSGEQLFSKELSDLELTDITDMCQLSDGHVFLLCNGDIGIGTLGELDPDTGAVSMIKKNFGTMSYLGTVEDELFCIDSAGLWKVDTENGSRKEQLSFVGTTYVLPNIGSDNLEIQDFEILGDQEIVLLTTDYNGHQWTLETLQRSEVNTGKIRLVMRGNFTYRDWIKEQITTFNQLDNGYYVVMEDSTRYVDIEECARLTSVEIATGKGPDLLFGNVLGDYLYGILQKGGLEDLSPYMKKSGIKEKDYFPATFSKWRNGKKIYGANVYLKGRSYVMDTAVLGTAGEPDIETLVEALLGYEDQSIYMQGCDSQKVLRMLLEGSEDLWGMINWKKGTCDFSGELFAGILETAKRYADDGRKLSSGLLDYNLYWIDAYLDPDTLKKKNLTEVWGLFDDGIHGVAEGNYILAINANSANKQGAWELVQFLLGEEAQSTINISSAFSVNKRICKAYLEEKSAISTYLTKERIEYLMKGFEDMRFFPIRTEPILDIICDEAQNYFNGTKDIDQIIPVIQNRVKLYLEETGS